VANTGLRRIAMPAKYKVTLTADEHHALSALVSKGKAAARKLLHARILLKADATTGPNWSDAQITTALDVGQSTVHRVRQAFVEAGLEAALNAKRPTERQYRKLDGAQEARLVALACSAPPEGRLRWTLQLLADKCVELKVVDSIGRECVRTTLKKTNLSPG
jgi:transposase